MRLDDLYQFENKTPVRVTYRDTDQMGVAYYANHLVWFEIGRTELIRELGLAYRDLEAQGFYLPVVSVQVDYRTPARYDDVIEIWTRVTKLSSVAIYFSYTLVRNDAEVVTIIAEGSTRHAFVGPDGKIVKKGLEMLGIKR